MEDTSHITLINAYEVPPEADDEFVASWERCRDFLAAKGAFGATTLHRALRADVDFRFVEIARLGSPDAWREAIADPAFPGREMPFAPRSSLYEVIFEDRPVDEPGGTVLINPFEVAPGDDDEFHVRWRGAHELLAGQPGYLGTRLHRALGPADFRFVNVARWSSPLMFSRAIGREEFRRAGAGTPFVSHPALYVPASKEFGVIP